jgi:hypothetical protein
MSVSPHPVSSVREPLVDIILNLEICAMQFHDHLYNHMIITDKKTGGGI